MIPSIKLSRSVLSISSVKKMIKPPFLSIREDNIFCVLMISLLSSSFAKLSHISNIINGLGFSFKGTNGSSIFWILFDRVFIILFNMTDASDNIKSGLVLIDTILYDFNRFLVHGNLL